MKAIIVLIIMFSTSSCGVKHKIESNSYLPLPGCEEGNAITFIQTGSCDKEGCSYEKLMTLCGEGTKCEDGVCVASYCGEGKGLCDTPPDTSCNADAVVTYEPMGKCVGQECVYSPTYTHCKANQICANSICLYPWSPCADITCDSPPPPGCEGNAATVPKGNGTCGEDGCVYPSSKTHCGETATCINGLCDASINPCDGVDCYVPPAAICANDAIIKYDGIGTCSEGQCSYSATEEPCDDTEYCLDGRCLKFQ